eukprot:2552655-Pyramimonas_sp.AAC.1
MPAWAPWGPAPAAPAGAVTSSRQVRSGPAPSTNALRAAAPSTGESRPPPSGPTRSRRAG